MQVVVDRLEDLSGDARRGWEAYGARVGGGPYVLPAWSTAIRAAYGLDSYCLFARGHDGKRGASSGCGHAGSGGIDVRGVLPLVHVKHWLFGNSLVSMPFCDGGAGFGNDADAESALIKAALSLADELGVPALELRCFEPLRSLGGHGGRGIESPDRYTFGGWDAQVGVEGSKVRMLLELPGTTDELMRSFKAKLRSQINKPRKEGLTVRRGGAELLGDFYRVFVENMRDLGSPVHSKEFIGRVLSGFSDSARVFVAYRGGLALAGSVVIRAGIEMCNPWASSLRRYSHLAPNMLLYWSMLEYACEEGCRTFDFGRSTDGEGTYRFKEQWGARPAPLRWYRFVRPDAGARHPATDSAGMRRAAEIWRRLPVPVTRVIGPRIRRYISL